MGPRTEDQTTMLSALGLSSIDELIEKTVPRYPLTPHVLTLPGESNSNLNIPISRLSRTAADGPSVEDVINPPACVLGVDERVSDQRVVASNSREVRVGNSDLVLVDVFVDDSVWTDRDLRPTPSSPRVIPAVEAFDGLKLFRRRSCDCEHER